MPLSLAMITAADAGGGTNQQRDWVMQRNILRSALYGALLIGLTAAVSGCGGGGPALLGTPPTAPSGDPSPAVTEGFSHQWANVGAKPISVGRSPRRGGRRAAGCAAPSPA